jgi:hypothetical protein
MVLTSRPDLPASDPTSDHATQLRLELQMHKIGDPDDKWISGSDGDMGCIVDSVSGSIKVSKELWGYANPEGRLLWNTTQLHGIKLDDGQYKFVIDRLRCRPLGSPKPFFEVPWNRSIKRRGRGAPANSDDKIKGKWDMQLAYAHFGVEWRKK